MLVVILFLAVFMWKGQEPDQTQQIGSITYADDIVVTYTEDDYDIDYQNGAYSKIVLAGNSASTNSAKVLIDGGNITILGGGVYEISGTLQDGSIVVHTNDNIPVQLVLHNASINSSDFSAIYVEKAESVILTLPQDTQNSLSDGANYDAERQDGNKPDAVFYCRSNLTINGTGTLSIVGNYQDGIKCNDTLKVMSGNIVIHAKDDGMRANDCMVLLAAQLQITAGNDAIYSEGDMVMHETICTISCYDDAIHAEQTVVLEPETLSILQCQEGVEGKYVIIYDGDILIEANDDGINAVGDGSGEMFMPGNGKTEITKENSYLVIYGGTILVESSGDGLDSNGAAVIYGGNVTVYGPENNGNASLDTAYGLIVDGGALLAAGSSGMAELPKSNSTQNIMVYYLPDTYSAGSSITLLDASGNMLVEGSSSKKFNWVCISTAEIDIGEIYTLYINGQSTATLECTASVTSFRNNNGTKNAAHTQMTGGRGGMRDNEYKTIHGNT